MKKTQEQSLEVITEYCFNHNCTACKLKKLCDEYYTTPTTIHMYIVNAIKMLTEV